MAWVKLKKSYFSSDEPLITIAHNRFSYNAIFSKIAELDKNPFVCYYLDEDSRKIGFEFKNIEEIDSFKVIVNKEKGNYSQSTELFRVPWIKKISLVKGINRFKPIRDGKRYTITLMPIFENVVLRKEYLQIPSSASGIYRYIDNGVVVYIGKGNIRDRLNETTRNDWKFDTIEYSIIQDSESQLEWESYWINEYKKNNHNHLPNFNLIGGKRS
jgi:hypothetical protein